MSSGKTSSKRQMLARCRLVKLGIGLRHGGEPRHRLILRSLIVAVAGLSRSGGTSTCRVAKNFRGVASRNGQKLSNP